MHVLEEWCIADVDYVAQQGSEDTFCQGRAHCKTQTCSMRECSGLYAIEGSVGEMVGNDSD